jgi:hypothetical protein
LSDTLVHTFAGITDAVVVCIELVRVVDQPAIVAGIADKVTI